jgi:hypothetical protein
LSYQNGVTFLDHNFGISGVRITAIHKRPETTRTMIDVAKESLAAHQENARLAEKSIHSYRSV